MAGFDLKDYVEVKERVQQFYDKHPDGRIQSEPPQVVTIGNRTFIAVTTRVYRTPDDPTPCQGSAWEEFPGKTPYTKDSEAMNAETSAMGRALAAAGIAVSRSIASRNEVMARRSAQNEKRQAPKQAGKPKPSGPKAPEVVVDALCARIAALPEANDVRKACKAEFFAAFGKPTDLLESQVDEAAEIIARYELSAPF